MADPDGVPEDRGASLLTNAQREYLRGEREVDAPNERAIRSRIRERTVNAVLDFSILVQGLDEEDIEKIRKDERLSPEKSGWKYTSKALADMFGFLYLLQDRGPRMVQTMKRGTRRAEERRGNRVTNYDIEFRFDTQPIERLERLRDSGEELDIDELKDLVRTGAMTLDEYTEELQSRQTPDPPDDFEADESYGPQNPDSDE
jgi:hypothetical protein